MTRDTSSLVELPKERKNTRLLKEISKVHEWDPFEEDSEGTLTLTPKVDINRARTTHIFKRHWEGTEFAKNITAITGDTLYNTLKKHPMGNLMLYAGGLECEANLLDITTEGIKECGTYGFALDKGEKWVYGCRSVGFEVWCLRKAAENIPQDYELEYPSETISDAVNTLLSKKTKLPTLESLIDLASDADDRVKEVKAEKDVLLKEGDALKEEVVTLKTSMKELALKAAATSSNSVKVKKSGKIPAGESTNTSIKEIFPDVEFGTDFKVPLWKWKSVHPLVPDVDPHYIFRKEELTQVLYSLLTNQRAYLSGHTGAGKTTLLEQVAAHLGYPFIRVNFDSEITRMDLIGRDTLSTDKEGGVRSSFVDGVLPSAMQLPCIFCCDEIDFVRPDVAYVMQAALEGNGLRITEDGDRLVEPHPMFRMFATGNTVGQGDEYGMYQGARPQSIALLDRFTVWIKVDYLSKERRELLVKRHFPSLSSEDQKILSQYMDEHLEAFTNGSGKVMQPISPRGMLAIAKATVLLGSIKEAMEMTVLNRANAEDYATLKGLVDRVTP